MPENGKMLGKSLTSDDRTPREPYYLDMGPDRSSGVLVGWSGATLSALLHRVGAVGSRGSGLKLGTVAGTTLTQQSGMPQRPHGMPEVRDIFGHCHIPRAARARTGKGIPNTGFIHTKRRE